MDNERDLVATNQETTEKVDYGGVGLREDIRYAVVRSNSN